MNGFVVWQHHNFDDFPVRLFATREEAECFCKLGPVNDQALRDIFGYDPTSLIGSDLTRSIVEYANGIPVGVNWPENIGNT